MYNTRCSIQYNLYNIPFIIVVVIYFPFLHDVSVKINIAFKGNFIKQKKRNTIYAIILQRIIFVTRESNNIIDKLSTTPFILSFPWFHYIPVSRKIIVSFSRLRFCHDYLSANPCLYLSLMMLRIALARVS